MNKTTSQIRDEIITAALPDVVFDGWSMDTINKAAQGTGHDAITVKATFPKGLTDALDAFADKADRDMLTALNNTDPDSLKIRERIHAALMARFDILNPHKDAVKESLKYWINPLRKPRAAKILWRTADRIWDWAGDTSTDYNRYTKRGLLSSILGSAMLIWINDDTEDMSKTNNFVSARIENVMQFGKIIGKLKA